MDPTTHALSTPATHLSRIPITSHQQNRALAPKTTVIRRRRRFPSPTTIFKRSETHTPSCIKSTTRTPYQTPFKTYIYPTLVYRLNRTPAPVRPAAVYLCIKNTQEPQMNWMHFLEAKCEVTRPSFIYNLI